MDNPLFVQIGNRAAGGPHKIGGVVLIVVSFSADPIKQFAAFCQFSDQVHYRGTDQGLEKHSKAGGEHRGRVRDESMRYH